MAPGPGGTPPEQPGSVMGWRKKSPAAGTRQSEVERLKSGEVPPTRADKAA